MKELEIGSIRIDGGTQPRVHLNEIAVAEYAESLTDGAKLPAVTVFFDGSEYWLADGFHRYFAHSKIGALKIDADVRNGSRRDAVLHSVGANASHGLRRTNEDKRRAVETLLGDEEWAKWSDRELSKACGVSVPFVGAIRRPEVAAKQQENRSKSAARRVESDSKAAKLTPQVESSQPNAPEEKAKSAPERNPITPDNEAQYEDCGPSESEIAFLEESETADREAYNNLVEIATSDDKLAEALALVVTQTHEIARLNAELRVVKESRDGYMNGKNEAIRMVKSLQRKLEKLEKAAA